jgi:hypothetical protein
LLHATRVKSRGKNLVSQKPAGDSSSVNVRN